MLLGFDPADLSPEMKVEFLRELSKEMLVTTAKLEALYLVLGDDLFFALALFAGDELRFPPRRTLRRVYLKVATPPAEEKNDSEN